MTFSDAWKAIMRIVNLVPPEPKDEHYMRTLSLALRDAEPGQPRTRSSVLDEVEARLQILDDELSLRQEELRSYGQRGHA